MANTLNPGDVRVGRLLDGIEDGLPDQAATLTFDESKGAELVIPFFYDRDDGPNPQYRKTQSWFSLKGDALPKTLVFEDDKGRVTFTGVRFAGLSGTSRKVGRVDAAAVILECPRALRDEYRVQEFISKIDGLREFARFAPVRFDSAQQENGVYKTTVELEASESVEIATPGFSYRVKSNIAYHGIPGRSFTIDDSDPYISTVSADGATIADHFHAHWGIRALLSLVFGQKLSWRSHRLRDDDFPLWMMDGSDRGAHSVKVLLAQTFKQHGEPAPSSNRFAFPLFYLNDLGADGLRKWTDLYANDVFRQAVEPAVEVINGATRFLEPQLMMLAIALDRFGYYRFSDKKRRAMFENIQKCLEEANLDWPQLGSQVGIAKAIAGVNNDLKHPDREAYPASNILAGVKDLAEVVARAQLFDLLDVDDKWRQEFLKGNDVRNILEIFKRARVTISDEGKFVSTDADGSQEP